MRATIAIALFAATMTTTALCTAAAHAEPERRETVLDRRGDLIVSEVTWAAPLPASAGPHPARCDTLSYLRLRMADGPDDPADADVIYSGQPGFIGGPRSLGPIAENTLHALARTGKHGEFWAMQRRPSCLDDRTGMVAAVEQHDYRVAMDYYFHGGTVDGRTYGGVVPVGQQAFLKDLGVRSIVEDWQYINSREIPDPAVRKQKIYLGGHSLGGPLTAYFAAWDFAGHAGYDEVAGLWVLDAPMQLDPADLGRVPALKWVVDHLTGLTYQAATDLLGSGLLPYAVNLGLVDPALTGIAQALLGLSGIETNTLFQLVSIAGIATRFEPTAESELPRNLPRAPAWDIGLSALYSRDLFQPVRPDFRDWRLTNQAMLASLIDSNTNPTPFSAGLGSYDGPVVERNMPVPLSWFTDLPMVGPQLRTIVRPQVVPADPAGRLNGWRNYDTLADEPAAPDAGGQPFATPQEKVCDMEQFAYYFGGGELAVGSPYDTVRTAMDIVYGVLGAKSGDLAALRHPDYLSRVPYVRLASGLWQLASIFGIDAEPTTYLTNLRHLDFPFSGAPSNDGSPTAADALVELTRR
ncbi:hypothetical protein [Nocardia concava]|uniref:hypothetical protein n=1 Tax=Nocardia concava TaxID=257281 RepID=UPI00030013D9|nr:hypothetical protein [Nocardia concava]